MAMSNAERQARYRAKLKSQASVDALGERTQAAADEALLAIWRFFNRPSPSGAQWADIDGCKTVDDYRAALASEPTEFVDVCRQLVTYEVGLKPEEAKSIQAIVEIADVLSLAGKERRDRAKEVPGSVPVTSPS